MMRVILLHPYTKLCSSFPFRRCGWFSVTTLSGLWSWPSNRPFDLGPGAECHPWQGQPSCRFWCFCDFSLSGYGLIRHDLVTLTFDLWRHRSCRWFGSSYFVLVPSLKFFGLAIGRYNAFSVSALFGLEFFDLLTSKCGHRSPVTWASFVPIFSFLRPFILDVCSGTGQTDGRTDRRRP